MKKRILCIFVLMIMLISTSALAAVGDEAQITETLRQAAITRPVQLLQWGDTAVCFTEIDEVKRLIVLEQHNGVWQIVINNPTALIQDFDWPQLWLDSDNAMYWTYKRSDTEVVRYHSPRNADGTWGPVDQFFYDSGYGEYTYIWNTIWDNAHGGEITRSFSISDENDNKLGGEIIQYLPASWLTDCIRLESFDVSRFPTMFMVANDFFAYENERFFREAAAALMPGYAFVKGMLKNDEMHFLMEKPDSSRMYVICDYAAQRAVNLIESNPLPAGTVLGWENFSDSLYIGGRCVTIQQLYSGKAGLEYIYDDKADPENFLFFGDGTVWQDPWMQTVLYGDHPWDDITQIDWSALPHSLAEASARMDSTRCAMVHNPNPADRLHLRELADRSSRSQGKYYTGTPVTVFVQNSNWTQAVCGDRRGYMMNRYLAFGQAGSALRLDTSAMPQLSARTEMLKVYKEPQIGDYTWHMNAGWDTMKVIGVIGKEWYHVWFPVTGEYGFVRQDDLTEGNG